MTQDESPPALRLLAAGTVEFFGEDRYPFRVAAAPGAIIDASLLCPSLTASPVSAHAGDAGATVWSIAPSQLPDCLRPASGANSPTDDGEPVAVVPLLERLCATLSQQLASLRQLHRLRQRLDRSLRHFVEEGEAVLRSLERDGRGRDYVELASAMPNATENFRRLLPRPPRAFDERPTVGNRRQVKPQGRIYQFADGTLIRWGEELPAGIYSILTGALEMFFCDAPLEYRNSGDIYGMLNAWDARSPSSRDWLKEDRYQRARGETQLQLIADTWDEFAALLAGADALRQTALRQYAEWYEDMLYLTAMVRRNIADRCDRLDGNRLDGNRRDGDNSCYVFFRAVEEGLPVEKKRSAYIRQFAAQLRAEADALIRQPAP